MKREDEQISSASGAGTILLTAVLFFAIGAACERWLL